MAASPSVDNLTLLTGIVKFFPVGGSGYIDLGEIESLTTSMDFTTLPYNSHRGGRLVQVAEATTGEAMSVTLTMNEASNFNLNLAMSGTMAGSPPVITIGTAKIEGALRYIGKNSRGIKVQLDLYDVIFVPNGDTDWLAGDAWAGWSIQGRAQWISDSIGFGELRPATNGTELLVNGSPAV